MPSSPAASDARAELAAVVVTHESGAVIESCLDALLAAAPRRRLECWVVDNARADDGPARAEARLGARHVIRRPENRGFAAGVNVVLRAAQTPWLALVNPDLVLAPCALDALVDVLEAEPRTALVTPRVLGEGGRPEASAGYFPSLRGEWNHALLLDRLFGCRGRRLVPPDGTCTVEWASGSCWVLRRAAAGTRGRRLR